MCVRGLGACIILISIHKCMQILAQWSAGVGRLAPCDPADILATHSCTPFGLRTSTRSKICILCACPIVHGASRRRRRRRHANAMTCASRNVRRFCVRSSRKSCCWWWFLRFSKNEWNKYHAHTCNDVVRSHPNVLLSINTILCVCVCV